MIVANNALERIQNILIAEETNLTLLTELAQIQTDILSEKLGGAEVPQSLTFIIVETTIARYRRVGAEGLSSKQIDVISNKYSENLFEPYKDIIADYATKLGMKPKRIVRVI